MARLPLRRACLAALTLTLASAALPFSASAQTDFPTKPITLIVPFPAGGSADICAAWSQRSCRQAGARP